MMQLMLLGLVLISVGMLLMIWPRKGPGSEERMKEPDECEECRTKTKGGAIIMIGPLPIVIGSDPRTTMVLMLIALLIMLIWALALIRR